MVLASGALHQTHGALCRGVSTVSGGGQEVQHCRSECLSVAIKDVTVQDTPALPPPKQVKFYSEKSSCSAGDVLSGQTEPERGAELSFGVPV